MDTWIDGWTDGWMDGPYPKSNPNLHLNGRMVTSRFMWRQAQGDLPQLSLIANLWPEAPEGLDAAVEQQDSDRLLLFKGRVMATSCGAAGRTIVSPVLARSLSLQVTRCGPSAATTWRPATPSPFPL